MMLELENQLEELVEEIQYLMQSKSYAALRETFLAMEPADIA